MLNQIRTLIKEKGLFAMLVNSTNEFLVEYCPLNENSRYKLTGFSGSTGDAVVTENKVYLFVDGRYHIQADNEVNHDIVTVVKLQAGDTFFSKFLEIIPKNSKLGLFAAKNSQTRVEQFKKFYDVVFMDEDFQEPASDIKIFDDESVDTKFCGKTCEEKLNLLRKSLTQNDAILITNLEEVSYLFNLRNFSIPYSSKILKRAIITQNDAKLFGKNDFVEYKNNLEKISGKVFVDKSTINARDFEIIKDKVAYLEKNPLQWMKAIKTKEELEHYKDCFYRTDKAVFAIRDFIEKNDNISEYDIDVKLEEYFKLYGAKNLSFKSIVAKDKNSALAHYSKSSKDEIIQDGSLVLIDCGAYYDGGLATDITRVFVKGKPTELQRKIYTMVLKAFLNAFNTVITPTTTGFDIDKRVRELFAKNPIDGFEFNHGLGHGIGISVHEYPPNLSCNELAKIKLEDNMCFTIEPGLYNKDYFGVRLENSCYLEDGKIKSFVKMNYEKKLINYDLLTKQELEWLKEFEVL